jgi:hypothetical protein
MNNHIHIFRLIFCVGVILLLINSTRFFIPLKNPAIYTEQKNYFKNDTILTPEESLRQLSLLKNLPPEQTITGANMVIHQSIAHYWENDGKSKYHMRIPFYENWILAGLGYIYPSIYNTYEYCNYKDTVRRGIGLCSQHAIALTDFLNENNILSYVVGLDGHVVSTAQVNEKTWWILDPDFGIIIPFSLSEIENSPQIVSAYYKNIPSLKNPNEELKDFEKIYGFSGNIVYPDALIGNVGYIDCNWKKVFIEKLSVILIWIIPLILMLPYIRTFFQKKHV